MKNKRNNESLVDTKYGKLCVEEYLGREKGRGNIFLCLCDCGMDIVLPKTSVGQVKSCGCNRQNSHKKYNKSEHTTWRKMKERCYSKKNHNYEYYGGRGIKMCDRWLESFQAFYYDMGPKPSKDHQIDRIDTDGDYTPENCRWSTKSENMINRRFKPGKSGYNNIRSRSKDKYRVEIGRQNCVRRSSNMSLENCIKLRDKWLQEYKDNPDKWIEETKNKTYNKTFINER